MRFQCPFVLLAVAVAIDFAVEAVAVVVVGVVAVEAVVVAAVVVDVPVELQPGLPLEIRFVVVDVVVVGEGFQL